VRIRFNLVGAEAPTREAQHAERVGASGDRRHGFSASMSIA
jgi:hypothetical protein